TTLFPEVRLKTYIEIRSADSQSPELMLAVPALAKGIFYDDDCMLGAWDLVKRWSWAERVEAWDAAHRLSLRARVRQISLHDLARELLVIARTGLQRQRMLDARGDDESIYLDRLDELVKQGRCPADFVIDHWLGDWAQKIPRLVEASAYRIAA